MCKVAVQTFKPRLHVPSMSSFFELFKNRLNAVLSHPFTHDVKKIEGAAHKNGDIDATCKQALIKVVSRGRLCSTIL